MKITGIILAAGMSSRMKPANKLLLKYHDHTIIEEVLEQLSRSHVDNILIITGHEQAEIKRLLSSKLNDRIKIIYNENYLDGRAESIKCAVESFPEESKAILFMVADKPTVKTQLINQALADFKKNDPAILYVQTPNGRGHPIIFSKIVFEELLKLKGDLVGKNLIEKYKDNLFKLIDNAEQIDIDTEDDYRLLIQNPDNTNR